MGRYLSKNRYLLKIVFICRTFINQLSLWRVIRRPEAFHKSPLCLKRSKESFFFAVARNKNSKGTKTWVCTDSQFLSIRTILICGFFSKASGSGQTIGETHGD